MASQVVQNVHNAMENVNSKTFRNTTNILQMQE